MKSKREDMILSLAKSDPIKKEKISLLRHMNKIKQIISNNPYKYSNFNRVEDTDDTSSSLQNLDTFKESILSKKSKEEPKEIDLSLKKNVVLKKAMIHKKHRSTIIE